MLVFLRKNRELRRTELKQPLTEVVPPLFQKAHIRHLSPQLYKAIRQRKKRDLFLFGAPGVGKSYTACALVRRWVVAGREAKRTSWDMLQLKVRSTFRPGATETELGIITNYQRPDLLVLEDIGTSVSLDSQESDFALRTLLVLFDYRIEQELTTIFTSNKNIEQISASFDARLASRLRSQCEEIPMFGKDKRAQEGATNAD